jgi:hypothetical protein
MDVTIVIADSVMASGGKLYVHGGGWHVLQTPYLPFVLPNLGIAVILAGTDEMFSDEHTFDLQLVDADGNPVGHGLTEVDASEDANHIHVTGELPAVNGSGPEGMPSTLLLAFNVPYVRFEQEAVHQVQVSIDGHLHQSVPLGVAVVSRDERVTTAP